jgi:AcrR family transcriptional regulator
VGGNISMRRVNRIFRDNKKLEIVQATYSVILEHGYCNTTTHLIAQKAGMNKSLLHYYFKDKNELMLDTHRYAIQKIIQVVEESVKSFPHGPEAMGRRIYRFWQIIKKDIDLMRILYEISINLLHDPKARQQFGESYGIVVAEVGKSIASNPEYSGISIKDAEATASIIMGALEGLIHHYMVDPHSTDFDYSVKVLIRILMTSVPVFPNSEVTAMIPHRKLGTKIMDKGGEH